MFVSAIGTAVPSRRYTKEQCWEAFADSDWFNRLSPRSHLIAKQVLQHDNGIDARWLALDTLAESFAIDPDTLAARFAAHAPQLASQAGAQALSRAGLEPHAIDAVIVSTCTGYLCPGLSGYVIESLGLRQDIRAFDLVGQGCAAAIPNWQMANALLDARHSAHVLSVCVEVCSAAMYLDDDPGVLISACLFGDGAGAAVLSRTAPTDGRRVEWMHSVSATIPLARKALRFEQRGGLLRNILTREVPQLAAEHANASLQRALVNAKVSREDISQWIFHAGGRDVLLALQAELHLTDTDLFHSRETLSEYGNLSSAFVYFVLQAALSDRAAGGWWWMSSFGAGFSCHGALLRVD